MAPNVPSEPLEDASVLYIIDREGDVKNLVYGSIHRYSVPPFHRIGAGSVLGAKRSLKIDRDVTDEKVIVLRDRKDEIGGRREKYVFARNEKKAVRLLRIRPEAIVDELDERCRRQRLSIQCPLFIVV